MTNPTPDFRTELARLVDLYYALGGNWSPHGYTDTWNDALASARTALATAPLEPKGAQAIDPVKEKAAAAVEKQLFPWRDRTTLATTPPEPSQISDGYHTFEELYEHRHALTLSLMKARPDLFWFSRRHNDGELCFGDGDWFIVGAELPGAGAITYHLPRHLWIVAELTGATELEKGRHWDGHTATDVANRLMAWAITPPPEPPADGEVAELVRWMRIVPQGILRQVEGKLRQQQEAQH